MNNRYIVREIALPVGVVEAEALPKAVAQYLRIAEKSVSQLRILRKSLDARARNRPLWRYAVEFASAAPLRHPRISAVKSDPPEEPKELRQP